MDNAPKYVSSYFTKSSANIIEQVRTNGNQICLGDITIQHQASYYGHRGGKGNLGKHLTTEHRANMSMANSGKDKWCDNLAKVKSLIDY
jgi:hypothetical protein